MEVQNKIDQIYEDVNKTEATFDFSADKRIDVNNLHTEEQVHPEICFRYNKRRANLQAVVDQLEELKKQTRSALIKNCVENPSLCDPKTSKYSDKKAESYYRLDSGYLEVIDALLKAKHELDCMSGMQRIIEDKKWMLKDLVVLSMSQYFESKETKETRVVLDAQFDSMDKVTTEKSEQKDPEPAKEKVVDTPAPARSRRQRR